MTRTTKARLTMQMMSAADRGNLTGCLDLASQMKATGFEPDLQTYTALMNAAAHKYHWLEAWAILDDMLASGVQPSVSVFNALLKAQRTCNTQYVWKVIEKMDQLGVTPNASTYTHIIHRFLHQGNFEVALQYFYSMKSHNITPEYDLTQTLISWVAQSGYPRLALDIADRYEGSGVRRLDHTVWMRCLVASAEVFYLEGVLLCWKKVVYDLSMRPTEGICLAVLDTAARHGSPDLATDALRVMKLLGVEWQEYHFAPIIEAFCHQKQFKEALQVLHILRSEGIQVVPETMSGLSKALTSTEVTDSIWAIIDEMYKEDKSADPVVIQLMIKASVDHGDLQRAIATYRSLADYGISATLPIFNTLLYGCVRATHRDLGDLLLSDMKAAKIKPDQETFETFFSLCLTQDDYEDAFFYLEEMKAARFTPPYAMYEALVMKCLSSNDSRYSIAVEEMKEQGHSLSENLARQILQAQKAEKEAVNSVSPGPPTLDGAALRFIETGGIEGVGELPKEHLG